MRKAVWGAAALAVWMVNLGWPLRDLPTPWTAVHRLFGVLLLVGYLLLSLDPPEASLRQRKLFIAGILCGIGSFLLAFLDLPYVANVLSRLLAVAVVALPLWLAAGVLRPGFLAAGILALASIVPALERAGGVATSLHAYVGALSVAGVAVLLHNPQAFTRGEKKPPRLVVASNIVSLTPEQKAKALADLERRYRAGEMPEHVYLDKRQELDAP